MNLYLKGFGAKTVIGYQGSLNRISNIPKTRINFCSTTLYPCGIFMNLIM